MTDYTFSVLRELNLDEISDLESDCRPRLDGLINRYFSGYDRGVDFPATASDLDLVRGSWLIDKNEDRPDHQSVVLGVGFAFGQLLQRDYGFYWSLAEDPNGQFVSMVRHGKSFDPVSVPPFSYVDKREHTQNVEVFQDFFAQVAPEKISDTN
ncbi:MAG: hypothetical protein IMF05_03635 [Proteobacteria bacterium]|nr:hypothetical protein [Pseudomonadota bacterium]